MTLIGYLDRLSAPAGATVDCMVSSTHDTVVVDLVRLLHGDTNPRGPGAQVVETDHPATTFRAREQETYLGSCVVVEDVGERWLAGTSLSVVVQPTAPRSGRRQAVIALRGEHGASLVIAIDESGRLLVEAVEASAALDIDWRRDAWYRIDVSVGLGRLHLQCAVVSVRPSGLVSRTLGTVSVALEGLETYTSVVIGADACERVGRRWRPAHCFNGKIERPVLRIDAASGTGALVGDWRFEVDPSSDIAYDVSGGGRHGTVVNMPARGVTGHLWTSEVVDFTRAPEQYGAMHFHDDDLEDAGWDVSARLDLPEDLGSGVYGVRLRAGDEEDVIPLVVTPGGSASSVRVAVLLPTFTYVAYANERMVHRLDFEGESLTDHPVVPGPHDQLLARHPEWGLSLYDLHSDGSTCVYSTFLRPIPNLRPSYRAWLQDAPRHLSADLYLVHWLTTIEQAFDVLTDHDVNAGAGALEPYDVIITGSHPEYVSGGVLDAIDEHLDGGGSLMYLGGNGFYWVTSQDPRRPHVIEVRRGHVGTRPSEGRAGELVHSTTGENGGLWRQRGRGPNRLTGVGMTAQGWDEKAPGYRRMPDSHRPEAAFLFEGIGADEVIGDFGLIMNGSSGDELDRFDVEKGSPEDTLVVARSTGHSDFYQLAGEDVLASRPGLGGRSCEDVRSDLTLRRHEGGGWVLSVGSICFTGSISHGGYDNNVARLLGNALEAFLRR